jgi:hypothetical protein
MSSNAVTADTAAGRSWAGIVIPAHNEERVIGRLLAGLLADAEPDEFDVVVVCNGCTDGTAAVVRSGYPAVRVVETPEAGKHGALRLGDQHTDVFPRVYLDADVEVTASDLRALISTPALAAAPQRRIDLAACSWPVRWFYEVWVRLPGVNEALFGRGVIALTEAGWRRIADLPPLMGDDLAIAVLFAAHERQIVDEATVVVHPPRTFADLLRRRVRAVTATAQLEQSTVTAAPPRTAKSDLLAIVRAEPRLFPHVVFFAALAVLARRRARPAIRSADYTTWLRDTSSRGESED